MSHPSTETLAAYWMRELPEADLLTLEEHLFTCERCEALSARMAALPRALAFAVPPIVTDAQAARLLALDPRARKVSVVPGGRAVADFSGGAEAQLVALTSDLRDATQVDVTLCTRDGTPLIAAKDVPFDSASGTVLIACRAHYVSGGQFPLEITLRVEAMAGGVRRSVGAFEIDHIPPAPV
jgi:hypothetical protein